jgi:2-polyprenyl-3-methyl-5-hydroxy-6-metoxy-1,4-benzoquinol methylase
LKNIPPASHPLEADEATREPQYQRCVELRKRGLASLGLMTNQTWQDDPKHLLFTLSRYKFVAKMLSGSKHVLEVGCADAFGTRLVLQEVAALTAVDFDPVFIQDVAARMDDRWRFDCLTHDILSGPVPGNFDASYALDVLEHISQDQESTFVENIAASLTPHGVLIIGSPSIQSQIHASEPSKAGHVNCKDATGLRGLLEHTFHNVFIFSMNDEVIHTGFPAMAHYLFALCCNKRTTPSL